MTEPGRTALIGASGQLGQDLQKVWRERFEGSDLLKLEHADVEVADPASVDAALRAARPRLVINTAAHHRVDVVEAEAERAFAVNATGALNLARTCRDIDAVLLHLSTDYVFGGLRDRRTPYVETDRCAPVNVYGVTKAAGEMFVSYVWPKHYVVRTSGLYGLAGSSGKGGNFVELMLRLAGGGKPIRVVDDQTLTPTSTAALARQIADLVVTDAYGTYHATCQGECTWYDFAAAIFEAAGVRPDLSRQSRVESGATADRPTYSVLENSALKKLGIDSLPEWSQALAEYVAARATRVASTSP